MKRTIASAAAILMMAGTAGPAFGKAHMQPADAAMFGQNNAASQHDNPQNLDARGLLDTLPTDHPFYVEDDPKGVSGAETSSFSKNKNDAVNRGPKRDD